MTKATWPKYVKQTDTYEVLPPDPSKEKLQLYYEYVPVRWEKHFAHTPARPTLAKYLSMKPGYPVKKNGPYVRMPVLIQAKRPYTTSAAMDRFFKLVDKLERELGINSVKG